MYREISTDAACLGMVTDDQRLLRIFFVNKCIDSVDKIKVNEKL